MYKKCNVQLTALYVQTKEKVKGVVELLDALTRYGLYVRSTNVDGLPLPKCRNYVAFQATRILSSYVCVVSSSASWLLALSCLSSAGRVIARAFGARRDPFRFFGKCSRD